MASRQRSFFDQRPASSNRPWQPRWQHNAHFSNRRGPPQPPPPPRSPIAASLQSTRKLGAFRYQPQPGAIAAMNAQAPVTTAVEKENVYSSRGNKSPRDHHDEPKAGAISPQTSRLREFPQTPIARVPFADLIENGDTITVVSPVKTPTEGVTWRQSPTSSDVLSQQRGTKRARSSSPPSSQRSNLRTAFGGSNLQNLHAARLAAPVNLQDLHRSISGAADGNSGAPLEIDLAMDLEKRFFSAVPGLVTPSRLSSAVADLQHSSSPLSDSAKLRRTRSCGIAFPASDTKRRRIAKSHSHVGHRSPTQALGPQERNARMSRMSRLLDQVDEGLLEQASKPSMKSSDKNTDTSLFSRDASAYSRQPAPGPPPVGLDVQLAAPKDEFGEQKAIRETHLNALSQDVARTSLHVQDEELSSDYGDNDLDDDLVGFTERKIGAEEKRQQKEAPQEQTDEPAAQQIRDRSTNAHIKNAYDDNDDDYMDDLIAADLEVLAASCDQSRDTRPGAATQQHQMPAKATQNSPNRAEDARNHHEPEGQPEPVDKAAAVIDVSSDEEFGGDNFDDIAQECDQLANVAEQGSKTGEAPLIPRYVVKAVYDGVYETDKGYSRGEKILHVEEERTKTPRVVHLRDAWLDSHVEPGVTVHVLAASNGSETNTTNNTQSPFNSHGLTVLDNLRGLLILHPDHLFSATVVADAFKCTRRAVLQDRVKATNDVSESQIFGHILHEVFQEALKANEWSHKFLMATARSVAARYLESLFELQLPLDRCVEALMSKLDGVQMWAQKYVSASARPDAVLTGPSGTGVSVGINALLDVEEHIWAPRYGLKGNIDATVQIHAPSSAGGATLTVPFELKTGRATTNEAHNAQTALYTLLLSDRYDVKAAFGILYYLETNATHQILAPRRDIMHMLLRRNELAAYARKRTTLPPMLRSEFTCSRCYAQSACFAYHKLAEDGTEKTSGVGAVFAERMGHLQPAHAAFFKKWDDLLTKEETDALRFRRELWSLRSSEREPLGRCFGGVVLKSGAATERPDAPKINRFEYVFVKQKAPPGFSFAAATQLSVGEPIVISDEMGHYALANGYVTRLRARDISVAVDRRLHGARTRQAGFDAERNQVFAGIMQVRKGDDINTEREPEEPVVYRIDKDEFSNGMATVRNNLIRMMEKDLFGAAKLRRLIVEGAAPTFRREVPCSISTSQADLNVDQRNAIAKVLSADDYALVLGMPGTGKTTTIAHLIRALVGVGKSVLLASYTHSAVDNILLKIADLDILRLGAESKIHPDVRSFADLACHPKTSFEQIQTSYNRTIVATTCLGINHPLFAQRVFDYCIVDEASQITLPVCAGPIRMAHRFVLVGDHYQLPPLVQNKEAQEGGLDVSLFKLLSEQHSEAVVSLAHQYRMCADIMSLSNTIVYQGQLKCGTTAVAESMLVLPNLERGLAQHHHSLETLATLPHVTPCPSPLSTTCWLRRTLDPTHRVLWLDTDGAGEAAREHRAGARLTNAFEVALCSQVVRGLLAAGQPAAEIGLMTPYRSQLAQLRQVLRPRLASASAVPYPDIAALEMHTADRFQGRDKDAVVLSLVRSNGAAQIGDLLADWRRLNVALTRARTKLVIVGSWGTMRASGNPELGMLCRLVEERGWRVELGERALGEHVFDDGDPTQTQAFSSPVKIRVESGRMAKKSPMGKREEKAAPRTVVGSLKPERILKQRHILRDVVNGVVG